MHPAGLKSFVVFQVLGAAWTMPTTWPTPMLIMICFESAISARVFVRIPVIARASNANALRFGQRRLCFRTRALPMDAETICANLLALLHHAPSGLPIDDFPCKRIHAKVSPLAVN